MSDNQDDDFQDMDEIYQQISNPDQNYEQIHYVPANHQILPTQIITKQQKFARQNIYKVKIEESENKIDMNILESQFYSLQLYQKQKLIADKLQRRYSDFDFLFQILEKKFPGFIFPAFPEKGILSYIKTKVTVTKDERLLKNRIKMIQRFLNIILNQEKFSRQKCPEIKKFFCKDSQYELFKKTEKGDINKHKSIVDSTWGMIKNFFKVSEITKYTVIIEEIKKEKQPFEDLLAKNQQLLNLITDELEANRVLCEIDHMNYQKCIKLVSSFGDLKKMLQSYNKELNLILTDLSQLEFNLQCENQDFMMMLKKIEFIEQMKKSEQIFKNLSLIENEFSLKHDQIQSTKRQKLKTLKSIFQDLIQRINEVQRANY